jgi:uncharacterized protein YwgA
VKLVSTKRTEKDLKKSNTPEKYQPDPYPYSTRLCLDKVVMEKLDISPKDFKVGQKVTVEAIATVKSLRMVEGKDYDSNEIELQITQIGVEKAADSTMKDAVAKGVEDADNDGE